MPSEPSDRFEARLKCVIQALHSFADSFPNHITFETVETITKKIVTLVSRKLQDALDAAEEVNMHALLALAAEPTCQARRDRNMYLGRGIAENAPWALYGGKASGIREKPS